MKFKLIAVADRTDTLGMGSNKLIIHLKHKLGTNTYRESVFKDDFGGIAESREYECKNNKEAIKLFSESNMSDFTNGGEFLEEDLESQGCYLSINSEDLQYEEYDLEEE